MEKDIGQSELFFLTFRFLCFFWIHHHRRFNHSNQCKGGRVELQNHRSSSFFVFFLVAVVGGRSEALLVNFFCNGDERVGSGEKLLVDELLSLVLAELQQNRTHQRIDGFRSDCCGDLSGPALCVVYALGVLPKDVLVDSQPGAQFRCDGSAAHERRDAGERYIKVMAIDGRGIFRLLLRGMADCGQSQVVTAED